MSDRSNENPILDPGGSIAEQLAAKDAEIERLKDALDRQAAHYGGALSIEKARAEKAERERDAFVAERDDYVDGWAEQKARAEKLAAALRKIEGDESGCIDGCCHHAFRTTRLAARAIERVAELERMLNITAHAIAEIEGEKRD